jgi:hypothetical protein
MQPFLIMWKGMPIFRTANIRMDMFFMLNVCNFVNSSCTSVPQISKYTFPLQALVSFKKYMPPSSSLLQGKHLSFSPSPLRLNIFRLFVILSLTQLYRYTPEIFLFLTASFKYIYRAPLRQIGQE